MIRVFSTKLFHRFARKSSISDKDLCRAVQQILNGLIDADLGSGLLKQRIARSGKGKSGGFRTIIAYRNQRMACFLYGFAKNNQDNIDDADLSRLRDLAAEILKLSNDKIDRLIADKNLIEVRCHDQTIS